MRNRQVSDPRTLQQTFAGHTFVKKRDSCCACMTDEEVKRPLRFFTDELRTSQYYQQGKSCYLKWDSTCQGYSLHDFKPEVLDHRVSPQGIQLMLAEVNQCPPPRTNLGAGPLIALTYLYAFGMMTFFLPYLLIISNSTTLSASEKARDLGVGIPIIIVSMLMAIVITMILINRIDVEYRTKRTTLINLIISDHKATTFKDDPLSINLSHHGAYIKVTLNLDMPAPAPNPAPNQVSPVDIISSPEAKSSSKTDPSPDLPADQEEKNIDKTPDQDGDKTVGLLLPRQEEPASPALLPQTSSPLIQPMVIHVLPSKDK